MARQFGEATQFYEKSAKLKPTPDVLTKLSNAQYYGGFGDKAIATLNRALQIDPKFANALYNLGMLKWQFRGDTKGAIESLGEAIEDQSTSSKSSPSGKDDRPGQRAPKHAGRHQDRQTGS